MTYFNMFCKELKSKIKPDIIYLWKILFKKDELDWSHLDWSGHNFQPHGFQESVR